MPGDRQKSMTNEVRKMSAYRKNNDSIQHIHIRSIRTLVVARKTIQQTLSGREPWEGGRQISGCFIFSAASSHCCSEEQSQKQYNTTHVTCRWIWKMIAASSSIEQSSTRCTPLSHKRRNRTWTERFRWWRRWWWRWSSVRWFTVTAWHQRCYRVEQLCSLSTSASTWMTARDENGMVMAAAMRC